MNSKPSADAKERERALDPGKSFIVQAPAGSGKTELLIQRCLKLLGGVEAPEEIVAMTFTRKAAGEMHARIIKALENAATQPRPVKEHEQLTWDLAREVLRRDQVIGWNLRENPSRLRIQTIDSLCASLVRQMPWLSRFGAPAEIIDDASDFYERAARETILTLEQEKEWSADVERLLQHLDNQFDKLESLLAGLLARRDQWLRLPLEKSQLPDLRPILEKGLVNVITAGLKALREAVPAGCEAELAGLAAYAASNISTQNSSKSCLNLGSVPGSSLGDVPKWLEIAEMLLTKKGEWRKKVTVEEGFPAKTNGRNVAEKETFARRKEQFALLIQFLEREGESFREQLSRLQFLPPPSYQDSQWEVIESLARLLPVALAQLRLEFTREGKTDFIEVSHAASEALGTSENPTDLALAMDCRIQHLLVDEFQDTSSSQFRLLEKLTAGWENGDGRTLFLVGDPMQSIYRFREAEVGLFLKAKKSGIGQVQLEPLTLQVNFRSEKGIVDWINKTFETILPRDEDIFTGAVAFTPSVASHLAGAEDAVEFHPFLNDEGCEEAGKVVSLIQEEQTKNPGEKIAILVRTKNHLEQIVSSLQQRGLRFRAVEISVLGSLTVIQDLKALTRAILHFGDRVCWLAILRAPWCGLSLEDLHALAGADHQSTVWTLLQQDEHMMKIGRDGRERLTRFKKIMGKCLEERSQLSLRRRVEGAWIALGGPACLVNVGDLENAVVFFDLLEELEAGGELADFDQLEKRVEELFALPDREAGDTLQLMSIHKAKGLEFDTVIVPSLHRIPRREDPQLMLWLERQRESGSDLLIGPIMETGGDEDLIYKYLHAIRREKSAHETGRLLYVAATRAKRKLHLLGNAKAPDKPDGEMKIPPQESFLFRLWDAVEGSFQEMLAAQRKAPQDTEPAVSAATEELGGKVLRRLPLDWKLPALPTALAWQDSDNLDEEEGPGAPKVYYRWAGEIARQVGIVVHGALRQIAQIGIENFTLEDIASHRARLSRQLQQLGVPEEKIADGLRRVEEALAGVIGDERGQWILSHRHAEAVCEYPLTGLADGRVVSVSIDRTFVDQQGVRWIVDYKLSTHEGAGVDQFLDSEQERYRPQLEKYAGLFEQENRPIRICLYFPLLKASREWEY